MARKARSNRTASAPETPIRPVALYIRVSTELQAAEGHSLRAQETDLCAWCTAKGWEVAPDSVFVDEGISGKSTARPEFQRMLEACRAGAVSHVVATKIDRLARNTADFLQLVDDLGTLGVGLAIKDLDFDSSTPSGKLTMTMFAALAEFERSLIVDRMMTGKRQNAREGGFNGAPTAYGYRYDGGTWAVDRAEAATVATIFERFNDGAPLRQIARELPPRRRRHGAATPWAPAEVGYILRNGLYAGLLQWDGVESTIGDHPAIVDVHAYEAAQVRLSTLRRGRPVTMSNATAHNRTQQRAASERFR